MTAVLLFVLGVFSLWLTSTAVRRRAWWLPAMLAGELAPLRLPVLGAATVLLVALGGLRSPLGWIGLVLAALSAAGMVAVMVAALRSGKVARAAVASVLGEAAPAERPSFSPVRLAQPWRVPAGVEFIENVAYGPHGEHNTADLYLPRRRSGHPILIQIHGGGWRGGRRHQQGRPLVHHLAASGWACMSISYRVSPAATFPDHLVDVKRAVAWARAELVGGGADRSFVAVTGGSAGAHLAAMAALTPNQADYQPGFETADTSVQACVAFYGIFDLLDRNRLRYPWPFVEEIVMKVSPAEAPEAWHQASPLSLVGPQAPPTFVIHGSHDYLVPAAESAQFAAALGGADVAVAYAELPGATHAFDVLASIRTTRVVGAVHAFLAHAHSRHRAD